MRPWQTVEGYLRRFFSDPRVRLAFCFQSKYLGMSPFRCPSLFSILSFLEYEHGVWHPIGGCNAVSLAMARVAERLGVEICLEEPVEEILFQGARRRRSEPRAGVHACDALVLNADFARAMQRLVPDQLRRRWSDQKLSKKKFSCSTFMLYLGIEGQYDLPHHNIQISADYEGNLKDIEERHVLSEDPSFYVQNASVTDRTLAPAGHSTLYVLAPVTHQHPNVDWGRERKRYRDLLLRRIAQAGFSDVERRIRYERVITPADWDTSYEIHRGATFNLTHSLDQMLHLRPRNRFEDLDGVYLVGGGTHPGSGLPVIFESARISSRLLLADLGVPAGGLAPGRDRVSATARRVGGVRSGGQSVQPVGRDFGQTAPSRARPAAQHRADPAFMKALPVTLAVEFGKVEPEAMELTLADGKAVRAAQRTWGARPVRERLVWLRRLRALISENARRLAEASAHARNRPIAEVLTAEVLPLLEACRFLETKRAKTIGRAPPGGKHRPLWLAHIRTEIHREALGLVLVIGPSNYPLFLPGVQLIQALVAGNAVLLKPGIGGTAAARALIQLTEEAGLNPQLVTLLAESVQTVHAALALRPDKVVLTGSAETGENLLGQLAPHLIPSVMELSGSDSVIVRADADLELATKALVFGLRLNAGRTCMAPKRVFVHASVATELEGRLAQALPGEPLPSIMAVANDAEALEGANASPFGLGASVFTADRERGEQLAKAINAGVVTINDLIVPTADPRIPFGGRGRSGFGVTRGGEGLLEFTNLKVITLTRGKLRPAFEPGRRSDDALFESYALAAHGRGWSLASQSPFCHHEKPAAENKHYMKNHEPIGVIGGGLGGLAAACTLAARGYAVTLFEKNSWIGGKAAVLEQDGFRFDMGPTILTLPSVLRRIFDEAGRRLEDYLDMVRLDPQWRCFFADGSVLDLRQDANEMAAALDTFAPNTGSGAGYRRFVALSKELNRISRRHFFYKPIGGLRDMFQVQSTCDPHVLRDVLTMRMGRSVAGTVRAFNPDPRVAQMIDHFTQYVGSLPVRLARGALRHCPHASGRGDMDPRGGTRAVPVALARLAQELGVRIRLNTPISQIETANGRVTGVTTSAGEQVPLSAVVSNSDSVRTHRELLDRRTAARFERRRRYEPACSGVVLYLGLKQRYDHLAHHDFVFSRDPHEEFDWIYRKGEPAPDPTCYLAATSCSEPDTAPAAGKRFTCWCILPICGRTMIGRRCCPPTGALSWTS